MRAWIHDSYGGAQVLRLEEVAKPVPGDDEVLIRTHATTVTSADWRALSLDLPLGFGLMGRLLFGITRPREPILGLELAGRVESVGKGVRRFAVGDDVFAMGTTGMGCHAEYKCMPEDGNVVHKPGNLSYGEAAALSFGGTTALVFFRKANLRKGERVLVNGASGAVGTAAVQIARHLGAEVTGVCSARNAELVESLGATRVIDYTSEDFTETGETWDVIVDTVGTAPYSRSRDSLTERGRLLLVLAALPDMLPIPWVALTTGRRIIAGPAIPRVEDVRFLAKLAEAAEFRPVIDRRYPFERIADAFRLVETGHKRGNVVVTLAHDA
jgi:NADPH:quinone reductase-like Zn-dependent oxidoreductase